MSPPAPWTNLEGVPITLAPPGAVFQLLEGDEDLPPLPDCSRGNMALGPRDLDGPSTSIAGREAGVITPFMAGLTSRVPHFHEDVDDSTPLPVSVRAARVRP